MTQIKIAYSTVPLNYLASCYSIPPVWFPQWPIPSHLFNHRELEIWMEWQLGQSSINQFLFVYCVYVVYACDAQTNCIKILTSLKQTAEFFNALGEIYKAFSVHERHLAYRLPSIQEAVGLVSDTLQLLRRNETSIRGQVANLPKTLTSTI